MQNSRYWTFYSFVSGPAADPLWTWHCYFRFFSQNMDLTENLHNTQEFTLPAIRLHHAKNYIRRAKNTLLIICSSPENLVLYFLSENT